MKYKTIVSISLKRLIYHDNHKLTSGRLSRFQSPLVVKSSQGRTSSNDLGRKFRVRSSSATSRNDRSHARVPLYPTYCVTSFSYTFVLSPSNVPIALSIFLFPAKPFLFFHPSSFVPHAFSSSPSLFLRFILSLYTSIFFFS